MQQVYSHGHDVENERADRAAALRALGFISNHNIDTCWVGPSFDSATLLGAGGYMYEISSVLRDVKRMHTVVSWVQSRSK